MLKNYQIYLEKLSMKTKVEIMLATEVIILVTIYFYGEES